MPRRPRLTLAGAPTHLVQRGVDRQPCFFSDADRGFYLELLAEHAPDARCAIHAFVLMTNHVHLLLTPQIDDGPSRLMQLIGQRYVRAINRAHARTGTLWEGRFRSTVATDEAYILACYRYIELNPVRAGMVAHPRDYPWSSHRANAEGVALRVLTPHERYLALGTDAEQRRVAYRDLFKAALPTEEIDRIRRATNSNDALGNDRFRHEVEAMLLRRIGPLKRGRKPKRQLVDPTDPS